MNPFNQTKTERGAKERGRERASKYRRGCGNDYEKTTGERKEKGRKVQPGTMMKQGTIKKGWRGQTRGEQIHIWIFITCMCGVKAPNSKKNHYGFVAVHRNVYVTFSHVNVQLLHVSCAVLRLESGCFSGNEGEKQIKWTAKSLGKKGNEERSKLRVRGGGRQIHLTLD